MRITTCAFFLFIFVVEKRWTKSGDRKESEERRNDLNFYFCLSFGGVRRGKQEGNNLNFTHRLFFLTVVLLKITFRSSL